MTEKDVEEILNRLLNDGEWHRVWTKQYQIKRTRARNRRRK